MRITESQLRQQVRSLLRELSSTSALVLEGPELDRAGLIKKFPDSESDINGLPPKWITWLSDRFGDAPKRTETHPFADALPTVKLFSTKEAGIAQKWKSNEQFKTSVLNDELFAGAGASFSPADPTKLTVDQLERLLALSERKKQRFDVDSDMSSIEADRVGKVGRWNIWMPTTRENSCKIAGYDPATRKEKTTWCTARMSGSNLFYNYTGSPGREITLFYIISDDPKLDSDWLSVGFVNGAPALKGQNGSLSVNRANEGLTEQSLRKILGSDHDKIMQMMTQKNKSLGGRHPTRDKIVAAAQSVNALQDLVRGLSYEEEIELLNPVLAEQEMSAEVLAHLANHKSSDVRSGVARHKNVPAEVLVQLARDKDQYVRSIAAQNKRTPLGVLIQLAEDSNFTIRQSVAKNLSAPQEILAQLSEDESLWVRIYVAQNPNASQELLMQLSKNKNEKVRERVAFNPNTSAETLMQLARDEDSFVRQHVAHNPSVSSQILAQLAADERGNVRLSVACNQNVSAETLIKLARDKDSSIRSAVARHKNAPAEVLAQLARDKATVVKHSVAENPNASAETLERLTNDKDDGVRYTATRNLQRHQKLNELKHLIKHLIVT